MKVLIRKISQLANLSFLGTSKKYVKEMLKKIKGILLG
jgi:Asp-tRNA(Asn)/Glu-tRNA(Gln) amidotransferase C subunit